MQRPFDDAYLRAYSHEHLYYEVWMFFQMVNALKGQSALAPVLSSVNLNAYIESFVVHLRNLIDFLSPTIVRDTDVLATDFCDAGTWNTAMPSSLEKARARAHKELAHMTTGRRSPDSRQWEFAAVANELKPILLDFTAKALPTRLSPRVRAAIPA